MLVIRAVIVRRDPGRIYMPDMAYSRAYETYSVTPEQREALLKKGIHFSNTPVPGTIKRGALFPFDIAKDKDGDTTNYVASKAGEESADFGRLDAPTWWKLKDFTW